MIFFRYVLRSLLARLRANVVTLLCVSLFVMASSLALMVYSGVKRDIATSAPPENVVVLAKGVPYALEARSEIDRAVAASVVALPGIKRDGDLVLAAREHVIWLSLARDWKRYVGPTRLRSIDKASFAVHRLKVIEGRVPAEGTLELMVNRGLQREFPNLQVGAQLSLPGGVAPVVGVYEGSSASGIGVLTPPSALVHHVKGEVVSSITLVAESADRVSELVNTINSNKALGVTATRMVDSLAQTVGLSKLIRIVFALTLLLALVAIIAILSTMNAAISVRLPELAALAAIGIRRQKLASIVAIECLLLTLFGALVGAGAAELLRKNTGTFLSGLVHDLPFDALVPVFSIGIGALAGVLGGIAPALRVRRVNIMETLR